MRIIIGRVYGFWVQLVAMPVNEAALVRPTIATRFSSDNKSTTNPLRSTVQLSTDYNSFFL